MSSYTRTVQWAVWGFLGAVIVAITGAFVWTNFFAGWRAAGPPLPVYRTVADFSLTNQASQTISLGSLRGQVWVADLIFTRCPGPCAQMTRRLAEVQAGLPAGAPVKLVSFSADPEFDTPAVLQKYGQRFGAAADRWWFLTGPRPEIQRVVSQELLLVLLDKKPADREGENDLFLHSTLFVVVDRAGRLRGTFEGAEPDAPRQVLDAVQKLLNEP